MIRPKVLVVEDDEMFQQMLSTKLDREGYEVMIAANGRALEDQLKQNPDVILLDIGLPDTDGLTLLEKIREYTQVPVIVVSGKGELVDKVVGLEMGADDYIGKPFEIKEVAARIKAQLRRYKAMLPDNENELKVAPRIRFDRWIFDRSRFQVFDDEGNTADLTAKECHLLEAFIMSGGKVLSREQILELARAGNFSVTDRAIDTQIARLRRKIGDDAGNPKIIQSLRGVGYAFIADVETLDN